MVVERKCLILDKYILITAYLLLTIFKRINTILLGSFHTSNSLNLLLVNVKLDEHNQLSNYGTNNLEINLF